MEQTKDRSKNSSRYLHRWFSVTLALIVVMSWVAFSVYSGKPAAAASSASAALNPVPVVVTSNITFQTTDVAPGARLSAFGTLLTTMSATAPPGPLPTELAGTFVEVNGVRQQLLAVTKLFGYDQIDFVLSTATPVGTAMISITSGDGTISQGTFQVRPLAPAVPSANADLQGPPNAILRRFTPSGEVPEPPPFQFNAAIGRNVTRPIDLTPAGHFVFLSLFISGISNVPNTDGNPGNAGAENVRVIIGGEILTPTFAGPTGLPGQDQIDVQLPRSLIGAGLVSGSVIANGFASNSFELEFSNEPIISFPTFSSFGPTGVLAGSTLTINGTGFDPQPGDNEVRIAGRAAEVVAASTTELQVTVPFGAQSGNVYVRTPQGEGTSTSAVTVQTSVSGVVQNTASEPLANMTARLGGTSMGISDATGNFIVPSPTGGAVLIEIDGSTIPASPPYPSVVLKQIATSGRDNQFAHPIYLQQASGPSVGVGGGGGEGIGGDAEEDDVPASGPNAEAAAQNPPRGTILSNGQVTLEIQPGTKALFPNGANAGDLTLTNVVGSKTPVPLPAGFFSSLITQITPFGVELTPGATLTFNNADGLPPGSKATLWMLDQDPDSPTVGQFVAVGPAMVSADGRTVQSAPGAVKFTSIYFVAVERPVTTITGRVVDCSGKPVEGAAVTALGRSDVTDANGNFVIGGVTILSPNSSVKVEASFTQDGQTFSASANVFPVAGGIVSVKPDLVFFTPNCRPRAYSVTASTCAGRPVLIRLLATETSNPGLSLFQISNLFPSSNLKFIIDKQPMRGTLKGFSFSVLTFNPNVTYTPGPGFVGTDTFIYSVINQVGVRSNLAFATIRVNACSNSEAVGFGRGH